MTEQEIQLLLDEARKAPASFNRLWAEWEAKPTTHPGRERVLVALFTLHAVQRLR